MIEALNEKNEVIRTKLGIIESLEQKITDHEKMVFVKCIKNEKLFSDVENLNQKFNEALKDLAESKKTTITLNEQLIIKENKVKATREG